MRQTFRAPVDSVAGRDVHQIGQHGGIAISVGDNAHIENLVTSDTGSACLVGRHELPLRDELVIVRDNIMSARAELRRMFFLHPSVFAFLVPWSLLIILMIWRWDTPPTLLFSSLMLALAFVVVIPAAWAMTTSRRALHDGLIKLRTELREIERDLAIAEAYQRSNGQTNRDAGP